MSKALYSGMQKSWVYILTNKYNTTLYIGVTSDLSKRVRQHGESIGSRFTKHYNVNKLVYFEEYIDIKQAIHREKLLKRWNRQWKLDLIKSVNPNFDELIV